MCRGDAPVLALRYKRGEGPYDELLSQLYAAKISMTGNPFNPYDELLSQLYPIR